MKGNYSIRYVTEMEMAVHNALVPWFTKAMQSKNGVKMF